MMTVTRLFFITFQWLDAYIDSTNIFIYSNGKKRENFSPSWNLHSDVRIEKTHTYKLRYKGIYIINEMYV